MQVRVGPTIQHFGSEAMAAALNQEILRSSLNGWDQITLTMSLEDAQALANALEAR